MILLGPVQNPQNLSSMELEKLYSIAESPQLSGLPVCGRTAELPKSAPGSTIE